MSRPGGNPGNKGGGRKSAYQELASAMWLKKLWLEMQDVEALEKKLLSKKYSVGDIAALKMLKGNERLVASAMSKLIPDLQRQVDKTGNDNPIYILDVSKDYRRKSNNGDEQAN